MAEPLPTDRAKSSVEKLVARMTATPALIGETLSLRVKPLSLQHGLVTTGIGQSEGVARLVARAAQQRGVVAEFVPLSAFLSQTVSRDRHVLLFSQALSPNAAAALKSARDCAAVTVVTSLRSDDARLAGVNSVTVPPTEESGLLVRVTGPRTAAAMGLKLLGITAAADQIQHACERAFARGASCEASDRQPTILTEGAWVDLCAAIPWGWMETLWADAPLICDALNFVHGAYQARATAEHDVFALMPAGANTGLWTRLRTLLAQTKHRLITFEATRADVFAFFEFAAFIDGVVSRMLQRSPVDLEAWPGRGTDGALYDWNGSP